MKFSRTLISYVLISNLVGCSLSATNLKEDRPYIGSTTTHNLPAVDPVRSISSFSDSLNCMDDLLRQSNVSETVIAVKTIKDPSTKAGVAASEMIMTALSQMSKTSGAFKVADFEIDQQEVCKFRHLNFIFLGQYLMWIKMYYVSLIT